MGGIWIGLIWRRIREVTGTSKCGNEISVSIKCEKFLG